MRSQRPGPGTEQELPEHLRTRRQPAAAVEGGGLGAARTARLNPAAVQRMQSELGNQRTAQAVQDGRQAEGSDGGQGPVVQRAGESSRHHRSGHRSHHSSSSSRHQGGSHHSSRRRGAAEMEEGESSSRGGRVSPTVLNAIAEPEGRQETYVGADGGQAKRIPKSNMDIACWEWAVRGAETSGGLDRGDYWAYLSGWSQESDVRELDALAPAVRGELQTLARDLQRAGLGGGIANLDQEHEEATLVPYMQRSVETFVRAHGYEIATHDPAGWITCHYKMSGGIGAPEHWWIELPDPNNPGQRVLVQTVPGIDHYEAGPTNLRWNYLGSAPAREAGYERYVNIEVPITALKGAHTRILSALVYKQPRNTKKPRR